MKVYDCFPFWREFLALEIRLEELYEVVDYFVIIESKYTHTGVTKPFHLKENLHKFAKYADKIILVNDVNFYKNHNAIERGNYQRSLIDNELSKLFLHNDDLIIISDSDEIPKRNVIENLKLQPRNVIIEISTYSHFINLYFHEWPRIRVLQYKDFRGAQKEFRETFINTALDQKRYKCNPFLRINPWFSASKFDKKVGAWVGFNREKISVIKGGGWHFTKIYNIETLIKKIEYSGHTEFNTSEVNRESIVSDLKNKTIPYGRKYVGKIHEIDDSFPFAVRKNTKKFKDYIYIDHSNNGINI